MAKSSTTPVFWFTCPYILSWPFPEMCRGCQVQPLGSVTCLHFLFPQHLPQLLSLGNPAQERRLPFPTPLRVSLRGELSSIPYGEFAHLSSLHCPFLLSAPCPALKCHHPHLKTTVLPSRGSGTLWAWLHVTVSTLPEVAPWGQGQAFLLTNSHTSSSLCTIWHTRGP